jgi:hypothetical protein
MAGAMGQQNDSGLQICSQLNSSVLTFAYLCACLGEWTHGGRCVLYAFYVCDGASCCFRRNFLVPAKQLLLAVSDCGGRCGLGVSIPLSSPLTTMHGIPMMDAHTLFFLPIAALSEEAA